jgi:pimeloyl-ACP methyl ester carboxylesterase
MPRHTTVAPPRATPPPLRPPRQRRWRRLAVVLAAVVALLTGVVLYGAYGYLPAEAGRGHQPHYTRAVPSRFVDTPLARFHYVHAGSGSPVILLSPGSAWVVAWKEQLPVLARHHSVYVVDLPGQGYTRLHDRDFHWNLAGMTAAIGTFMDAVGVRRAALAGNSWSGGWALAFAQRHPERVSRLALLDATALDTRDVWTYEVLKYPVVGELLTNLFGASRSTVRGAVDDLLVHRQRATPELVDDIWAPLTFHDNLRANYLLERGLHWRETQRALPATRTPTLVLWGRQDKIVPVWQAERLGRLLPDARVRIFDGCGHGLELDCPGQVNPLLEDFFQDSGSR